MSNKSAVILVSGGMDSATAVYEAIEQGTSRTSSTRRRTDSAPKTRSTSVRKALAEEVDAADFLHIETGHLSQIGASSLTDEEMEG